MGMIDLFAILVSYALGCFNTGYYYIRLFYQSDIRDTGTNVTGAYNVSRLSGKKGFFITFLGDSLKGALAVLLCRFLEVNDIVTMLCIFMVILGHIFPLQLKFKGGKGLSTAFGAFLTFHPVIMIFWLVTGLVMLPIIRRYTITCLFALMLLPLELFIGNYPIDMILFFILYAILISLACLSNLKEFLQDRAYQGGVGKKKQ